jgi:hypothetical protein
MMPEKVGGSGATNTPKSELNGTDWEHLEHLAKSRCSSAKPHAHWLEHREHLEHLEIKRGLTKKLKPPPLTPAERQRRHRAKRKAERLALLERLSSGNENRLMREGHDAAQRQERATRNAAEQGARLEALRAELEPLKGQLQALRVSLRALLGKCTPAVRHMARRHLQETGFIEWLDMD